ncbi:hypothetical protein O6H91_07G049000 [Diphasiastrum complanatum]|uniref:Uncharacterized protein n=1 Tax=Diphasiastrum complanatum TaxID=34168 RepID=A0ACC2D4Z5_DIPCM|nr:hypothetical protein O6H91_07G049000 [Diphasiastrum complanatum]
MESPEEADYEAKEVFSKLKPLCTQLLEPHGGDAGTISLLLRTLTRVLKDVPAAGLQTCIDYVLFPLLLLLDASVDCRASPVLSKFTTVSTQSKGEKPFLVADKVAEGVLSCLEVILERCSAKNVNQMSMLLRKLTAAAMLSPDEASEEFRHGVVKCLKALFSQLEPCDNIHCRCKILNIPYGLLIEDGSLKVDFCSLPMIFKTTADLTSFSWKNDKACVIAVLLSEDMSAAIGHLLSLLLKVSQTEAARGGLGSGRLRVDALLTMRAIVLKVGAADALAFFLPGVVSGLAKAMRESWPGTHSPRVPVHIVGAAGITGAIEQAVKGMAEFLVLVLADVRNSSSIEVTRLSQKDDTSSTPNQTASSAEEALKTLHVLSSKYSSQSKNGKEITQLIPLSHKVSETIVDDSKSLSGSEELNIHLDQGTQKDSRPPDLRVDRSPDWLRETTTRVNGLLSATFPTLCAHPTPAVRHAVAEGCGILLMTCSHTLRICVPLFLECLLALACDEWRQVASTAYRFLEFIFSSSSHELEPGKLKHSNLQFNDNQLVGGVMMRELLVDLIHRLIDDLPKTIAAADETMSVLSARRLAAALYFLGPHEVHSSLFHSSATTSHFLSVLTQCLGFSSAFNGPLKSVVLEVSELYNVIHDEDSTKELTRVSRRHDKQSNVGRQITDLDLDLQTKQLNGEIVEEVASDQLPRVPPWLFQSGKSKLYDILALIIRLAGIATSVGCQNSASLKGLVEPLLINMQHAAVELGHQSFKEDESILQPRYRNGQVQRYAATIACVLNELIYGASGVWLQKLPQIFTSAKHDKDYKKDLSVQPVSLEEDVADDISSRFEDFSSSYHNWEQACKAERSSHLLDLVSEILHDYMTSELWDLPLNLMNIFSEDMYVDEIDFHHFLLDNAVLQQVLVEGVGVCAISLGKSFEDCGLLGLVLYPLLEKLGCPNNSVAHAATLALRAICRRCGYDSVSSFKMKMQLGSFKRYDDAYFECILILFQVKSLVAANADHIIDSLCRQLRHLTLHPHAPNLLAVILCQTGAAPDLLPLLKEPLQGLLLELEIPGRQQHAFYTVPILKAVREIIRAAKREATSVVLLAAKVPEVCLSQGVINANERVDVDLLDHLDEIMHTMEERQRFQCSIAGIVTSCLISCAPLLASKDQQTSLLALDILEDGITALADVESALNSEKVQLESLVDTLEHSGHKYAQDIKKFLERIEKEANKLLPTTHQVWPHLVPCLRQSWPSVVVRSLDVIALASFECGGQFLARRFKDALPSFVALFSGRYSKRTLDTVPGNLSRSVATVDRNRRASVQEMSSPAVLFKVQEAALKCVRTICERRKSAPALEAVIGSIAAWVAAIGCSNHGLKDLAADTLLALSNIDADLVWMLVADIAYNAASNMVPICGGSETCNSDLPPIAQILPSLTIDGDALFMQYAGRDCNIKTDRSRACSVLGKLESSITDSHVLAHNALSVN